MGKYDCFHCASLSARTEWLISDAMPSEVPLVALPGWSLVTPKGVPGSVKVFGGHLFPDGRIWLSNDLLVLRYNGDQEPAPASVFKISALVLRCLRWVSRQFAISDQVTSSWQVPSSERPEPWKVVSESAKGVRLRDYYLPTALDARVLEVVGHLADLSGPPHVSVMLDALAAFVSEDYRLALLYAAIAAEALAATVLDGWHQEAITKRDATHRVVDFLLPGGGVQAKDPIYDLMLGKDDFGCLLHERPLYLQRRSLLVDRQEVYRQALKLYGTRNKIAHTADVPAAAEKCFALTAEGARDGLRAAVDVADWFGDSGPYIIWNGFVDAITGQKGF